MADDEKDMISFKHTQDIANLELKLKELEKYVKGFVLDTHKSYEVLEKKLSRLEGALIQTTASNVEIFKTSDERIEKLEVIYEQNVDRIIAYSDMEKEFKELSELKNRIENHKKFYDVAERNEGKGTDWSWRVQIIDRIIDTENHYAELKNKQVILLKEFDDHILILDELKNNQKILGRQNLDFMEQIDELKEVLRELLVNLYGKTPRDIKELQDKLNGGEKSVKSPIHVKESEKNLMETKHWRETDSKPPSYNYDWMKEMPWRTKEKPPEAGSARQTEYQQIIENLNCYNWGWDERFNVVEKKDLEWLLDCSPFDTLWDKKHKLSEKYQIGGAEKE